MAAQSPNEMHILFRNAFNGGDVDALVSLYEPDAILIIDGKQVIGRDNIRAALESLVSVGAQMTLTTRSIIESREGLALLHGDWIVERKDDPQTRGMSTELIRKQKDGTWLFVIDNPSTPVNEQ